MIRRSKNVRFSNRTFDFADFGPISGKCRCQGSRTGLFRPVSPFLLRFSLARFWPKVPPRISFPPSVRFCPFFPGAHSERKASRAGVWAEFAFFFVNVLECLFLSRCDRRTVTFASLRSCASPHQALSVSCRLGSWMPPAIDVCPQKRKSVKHCKAEIIALLYERYKQSNPHPHPLCRFLSESSDDIKVPLSSFSPFCDLARDKEAVLLNLDIENMPTLMTPATWVNDENVDPNGINQTNVSPPHGQSIIDYIFMTKFI